MNHKNLLLTLGFVLVQYSVTGVAAAADLAKIRSDGINYLNTLRSDTGMIEFSTEEHLDTSSYNHAHYQMLNNAIGHGESSDNDGYTGSSPAERAVYADYLHRRVTESISNGQDTVQESIDGLFASIYHRFGFLSFDYDEIGIGADFSDSHAYGNAYVYDIGVSQLRVLCAGESSTADHYYYNVCADEEFRIEASEYENAVAENANANPAYVLWPYDGQNDTLPVFFEESPDPLPDCSVSGYPVSIQFNPQKSGTITLTSFKLYDESSNSEVTNTTLLDKDSDPNDILTEYEFALFPMERLPWDTRYRAELTYQEDGTDKKIIWKYATKPAPYPYYRILEKDSTFDIKSGQTYLLYLPPESCSDTMKQYSISYSSDLTIEYSFYDYNTIKLTATGSSGTVNVSPDNGRDFSLTIADSDTAIYPDDSKESTPESGQISQDFNGDGKSDILFKQDNGAYNIWLMSKDGKIGTTFVMGDRGWNAEGVGDFNGDGKSDILFKQDNGAYNIWLMSKDGKIGTTFVMGDRGWSAQ